MPRTPRVAGSSSGSDAGVTATSPAAPPDPHSAQAGQVAPSLEAAGGGTVTGLGRYPGSVSPIVSRMTATPRLRPARAGDLPALSPIERAGRPWYERHGFAVVAPEDWTPALREVVQYQTEDGLDWTTRVHMRIELGS